MFLVGVAIIILGTWVAIVVLGSDISSFLINTPALISVIGMTVAVLTATRSFKLFFTGLKTATFPANEMSEETRIRAAYLFRLLSRVTLIAAAIVTLIALVHSLMGISGIVYDGTVMLFRPVNAAFLTQLHAFILILAVYEPVAFILQNRPVTWGDDCFPKSTNRKFGIIMLLLGFAIVFICTWFAITALRANVKYFLNPVQLLTIFTLLVGILTATRSFKMFAFGLNAAAFPNEGISEEMRTHAVSLFRLLSKTAAMAAVISMQISLVVTLQNLDFSDDRVVRLSVFNIAVAILAPLYALILIIAVFEPVVFILKNRRDRER